MSPFISTFRLWESPAKAAEWTVISFFSSPTTKVNKGEERYLSVLDLDYDKIILNYLPPEGTLHLGCQSCRDAILKKLFLVKGARNSTGTCKTVSVLYNHVDWPDH